ncbi:structure-specific endonuclease subunit SLX1 [Narcine bancroftii]|uniref:structure-specific endonuclease subunit SLX1 n=1 Tax=Narcine bancroftii TaxID=1343680 RepID=UPI003831F118
MGFTCCSAETQVPGSCLHRLHRESEAENPAAQCWPASGGCLAHKWERALGHGFNCSRIPLGGGRAEAVTSALPLQFEWSWQHPSRCRMLAGVTAKARGEGSFPYHLRLLWELLRCPRWGRFALTLRWIHQELRQDWPPDRAPLAHISLAFGEAMGEVTATGEATVTGATARAGGGCSVCGEVLTDRTAFLPCLHPRCTARSHIVCLARNFLQDEPEHLLPLEGPCPRVTGRISSTLSTTA